MNNSSNTPLGKKLLNLRKEYKMTQNDVAEILGMSRTSFSKYENGIANPPLQVLRKIAAIYNVGLEYLIFDENTLIRLNDPLNEDDETAEVPFPPSFTINYINYLKGYVVGFMSIIYGLFRIFE